MKERSSHPPLVHCPRCASRGITWHSAKNFECSACGFMLYLNVAAAVAVIIEAEGKILFGLRRNEPGRGMLDLPGGFADPAESAEECARREVREETGLEIGDMRYLLSLPNTYLYRDIVYDTLDIVFTVRLDRMPPAAAGDDLTELVWVDRDRVDLDAIAFSSLREAVRRYCGMSE